MFLQIHFLTPYHASLLNRDDAGLAKRINFGNALRLRISSQCQKRHWREHLAGAVKIPDGVRTRDLFERVVLPALDAHGVDAEVARRLAQQLANALLQKSAKAKEEDAEGVLQSKQPVFFGRPEVDYFVALLAEAAGAPNPEEDLAARLKPAEFKKNLAATAGAGGAGLTSALFGRFVTSDLLARADAPVHVAHALTVHPVRNELDYFTVGDDLNPHGEGAAAHANDMDLGAGLFYGYVVVDIPLLVSNLTGCEREAWEQADPAVAKAILEALIEAVLTISPGAKLGATAPYARGEFVLLEAGTSQPRALSAAYLKALPLKEDPLQESVDALVRHMGGLDAMYGDGGTKRWAASTRPFGEPSIQIGSVATSIQGALGHIFGGGTSCGR